jgi:glycosyltransferase involved in cell wall biosynthesis
MNRPLEIAVVAACPFPLGRGTPVRIRRLAEALARRGHRIRLVTYHLGDASEELPFEVHRTPNLSFYRQHGPGPSYTKLLLLDPLLCLRLRKVLTQRRIDVIHAHHYEGLLVALAARGRSGPPIVYDAHTMLASELQFYRMGIPARFKRWLARELDRSLPRRADHIVTVTDEIRERLSADGIAPDKLTVVFNGVEPETMAPEQVKFTGGSEGPLLGFAGNLAPYQGVPSMLEAFRLVLQQRPAVRLVIVTDSPTRDLERQTRDAGVRTQTTIVEAGFDEVPTLLRSMDILLNPRAVCAGVPQKLLNYMAAGKPIVSFAGSGRLLDHGCTGWLVDGDRPEDFARGILDVLADGDLARRLGANARDRAAAHFTWDAAAAQLETVLEASLR